VRCWGGYTGDINDKQTEKIQRMVAKGKYLLGLVNDYLNLARLEGGELELKASPDVDFTRDVVNPAMDITAPQRHLGYRRSEKIIIPIIQEAKSTIIFSPSFSPTIRCILWTTIG